MNSKCAIASVMVLFLFVEPAFSKDAGNLLEQFLDDPAKAVHQEELALVTIISVKADDKPKGNWARTGTLELKTIESTGKRIPKTFTVRFYKRAAARDAWTWDDARLEKGKRLLGFFNTWNGHWAVRQDGRHDVINNPEQIKAALLTRTQKLFKTKLRSK